MNNSLPEETPLYTLQPVTRFSDRASDYAKFRPGYPAETIAALLAGLGEPTTLKVADIGAGTGISARLLADRGLEVWAIEPNLAMQQAADPHPRVQFLAGTAENTGLDDAAVDLVTCFQSFHWFNPDFCLPEFRRIVKPTGCLALVWNQRDRVDAFTNAYTALVQHISNFHPAEQRMVVDQPLQASADFGNLRRHTFPSCQGLDLPGLIGRAQSVSYIPNDEQSQQQLIAGLEELFHQWVDTNGLVYLVYNTQVFLADPL